MNKKISIKDYPYKYIHGEHHCDYNGNWGGCNKIAFYLKRDGYKRGDILPVQDAIFHDGKIAKSGDKFWCGNCGKEFMHPVLEMVVKRESNG